MFAEAGPLRIVWASARNSFVTRFTAMHPILWLFQILITSFFAMYFFAALSEYIGNPEVTVSFVVIGNAVQSVAATTLYSVAEIPGVEKHTGTLGALIQSPSSLFSVFLGMSAFGILTGIFAMFVSLGYAAFVFGISFASCNFLSVGVILLLTCLSLTGLGMLLGSAGIRLRTAAIIANIFAYIGLLISGVNFPVSYLPDWVQAVSYCMPLTYAVEAVRGAVDGASLIDLYRPICMMILLGTVFMIIAWFSFKFFEESSRNSGKTDSF
ncbi:MAG: ABC transporter permease [Candidatus Methanoplasma sp.]|jgi:ABC-2 type transport system permease protein|nr:ABC transporter permease [Candidatus Methanoplasma sp.]